MRESESRVLAFFPFRIIFIFYCDFTLSFFLYFFISLFLFVNTTSLIHCLHNGRVNESSAYARHWKKKQVIMCAHMHIIFEIEMRPDSDFLFVFCGVSSNAPSRSENRKVISWIDWKMKWLAFSFYYCAVEKKKTWHFCSKTGISVRTKICFFLGDLWDCPAEQVRMLRLKINAAAAEAGHKQNR